MRHTLNRDAASGGTRRQSRPEASTVVVHEGEQHSRSPGSPPACSSRRTTCASIHPLTSTPPMIGRSPYIRYAFHQGDCCLRPAHAPSASAAQQPSPPFIAPKHRRCRRFAGDCSSSRPESAPSRLLRICGGQSSGPPCSERAARPSSFARSRPCSSNRPPSFRSLAGLTIAGHGALLTSRAIAPALAIVIAAVVSGGVGTRQARTEDVESRRLDREHTYLPSAPRPSSSVLRPREGVNDRSFTASALCPRCAARWGESVEPPTGLFASWRGS